MCGIAGAITTEPISEERIRSALASLKHRGPDSQSYTCRKVNGYYIYLLHTRLSILDLSNHSSQPIDTGSGLLVVNGEVYNYVEAKKRCSTYDARDNDSVVLARLLKEHGLKCLEWLEGMWAFAYLDLRREEFYLSRDRFGEKPLYYINGSKGTLYFASEPKAIWKLSGIRPSVNHNHVKRYMVNGYKSLYMSGETFYNELKEVKRACNLRFNLKGEQREEVYWKVDYKVRQDKLDYGDIINDVRGLLKSSLEIRLRSDVPIAFCLSGGVDSTSLVALAKDLGCTDINTFTVINSDHRYEEYDMISLFLKSVDVKNTQIEIVREGFIKNLKSLIRYHDAPVYTMSQYLQWTMMKEIALSDCKVTLSGIGADEIFSGYYDHHSFYLSYLQATDSQRFESALKDWLDGPGMYVRNPKLQDPTYFNSNPMSREHIYLDADKFASRIVGGYSENFTEEVFCGILMRNRMANELFYEAVPVLLHDEDRNAMSVSLENRSPYLDRPLVEYMAQVPTEYFIKDGLAKSILRDSVGSLVPRDVVKNKRKVGFNVPIEDLLDLRSDEVDEILETDSPMDYIVSRDTIRGLIESTEDRLSNEESKYIFNYFSSRFFMEYSMEIRG